MFERLATNPDVDVAKLERLIAMRERIVAQAAKTSFDTAFSAMQGDLPTVVEDRRTNYGRFATLEQIISTIRPVLTRHGFSLSHRTEWPQPNVVKVIGILAHQDGHQIDTEFLSVADTSGSKNAIQSLGSAITYGRRYTTNSLLGIVTSDEDDDGAAAGRPVQQSPVQTTPEGFYDWLAELQLVADEGTEALHRAWRESSNDYRRHLVTFDNSRWEAMKAHAKARQTPREHE